MCVVVECEWVASAVAEARGDHSPPSAHTDTQTASALSARDEITASSCATSEFEFEFVFDVIVTDNDCLTIRRSVGLQTMSNNLLHAGSSAVVVVTIQCLSRCLIC